VSLLQQEFKRGFAPFSFIFPLSFKEGCVKSHSEELSDEESVPDMVETDSSLTLRVTVTFLLLIQSPFKERGIQGVRFRNK
jgi:hypothetical protein